MLPAVCPPTSEHVTPRFNISGIQWLCLRKFGLQNLIPYAFFKHLISLKLWHGTTRQTKFIYTYGIHAIQKAMHIHLLSNLIKALPIDL